MKQLLSVLLTLVLVSVAQATVVDVVTDGVGDQGNAGTVGDPLAVGETIPIKVVLNDGHWLSSMNIGLAVTGSASLSIVTTAKGAPDLKWNAGFAIFSNEEVVDNAIEQLTGVSFVPIEGEADLVWNLLVTCTGSGNVPITLSVGGPSEFSTDGPFPPWEVLAPSDLGQLTIFQSDNMTVSKMTVKAGKDRDDPNDIRDRITVSGRLGPGATQEVFDSAGSVQVRLLAGEGDDLIWTSDALDVLEDFSPSRKGVRYAFKRRFSRKERGDLSLARFDFATSPAKFWLTGKNLDLSCLKPPMTVEIIMGSYTGVASGLTDADVNGRKRIPLTLLSGCEDVIRSKKPPKINRTQTVFKLKGEIAAEDPDVLLNEQVVTLTWGLDDANDAEWVIPAEPAQGAFEAKGRKWVAKHTFDDGAKATVMINFHKGTFSVTVRKDSDIPADVEAGRFQMTWDGFEPDPDDWE